MLMAPPMKSSTDNSRTFTRWLRIIHRDLGFLMVGVCLVYGLSGILLNHMDGKDPAFKTVAGTAAFAPGLDAPTLTEAWKERDGLPVLKRILPGNEGQLRVMCQGGIGIYQIDTGETTYETSTKRVLVYWINKLHYNQVKGWSPMADLFAISLIFFALSGLWIVKGKKGLGGTGKWYLLAGLLIPVIYIILS